MTRLSIMFKAMKRSNREKEEDYKKFLKNVILLLIVIGTGLVLNIILKILF